MVSNRLISGFSLLYCVVVMSLMTACSSGTNSSGPTPATVPPTASTGNVTFISHRYMPQDQPILQSYQDKAGKGLAIYRHSGKEQIAMANRGELKGDVIVLEDLYQAHQLIKAGVLQPYQAGTFGDYVPNRFVDDQGYYAALTRWSMSFIFNQQRVDLLEMRNYAGVLNPKYEGRVTMAHPDSSGLTVTVAHMLAAYGPEPATIYLNRLKANLKSPPQGNDFDAIQRVAVGDADIAFVNGSAFLRYKFSGNKAIYDQTEDLGFEVPVDAAGNNYFNATPVCILANAPMRNYAVTLVEFLTLKENQDPYAEAAMEYPVHVFAQMSEFLNTTEYSAGHGKLTLEMAENQLDNARALIRQVFAL